MSEFNSQLVIPTLKQVVSILDANHIKYRFLGSVVMAAINGKQYRDVGDLDLFIDIKGKDVFYNQLIHAGYKPAGGMFGFARKYLSLETLSHPQLLSMGYFYGEWQEDGWLFMGNKLINATIESYAIAPTRYTLHGVKFLGLPHRIIATGVISSAKNPKRRKELEIIKNKKIEPLPNTYIHINILGLRADWIYHLVKSILNIIGVIRTKFNLPFDPWR